MHPMPGGVVKKDKVKMVQGSRVVGDGSPSVPPAAGSGARIVEQSDAGALIEVTCTCGEKTYLQCDYAADPPRT